MLPPFSLCRCAPVVLAALCAAPQEVEAPDGHRGFGPTPDHTQLHQLLRNPRDEDETFMRGLRALPSDVELLARLANKGYENRGYYALLPVLEPARPEALYEEWARRVDDPFVVALPRAQALALARMAVDDRFHARYEVHRQLEVDLHDFRQGMELLEGSAFGAAALNLGSELNNVTRLVDLTAALLRARRLDLEALSASLAPAPDEEPVRTLARALQLADHNLEQVWNDTVERTRRRTARMSMDLFTVKLRAQLAKELGVRANGKAAALEILAELHSIAPFTEKGEAPADPAIERLSDMDRHSLCIVTAEQGIAQDPLLADLYYFVAEGENFAHGSRYARSYYARYLRLRGINIANPNSINDRYLTAWEDRAVYYASLLSAVPPR
jgi:hypothetical protein